MDFYNKFDDKYERVPVRCRGWCSLSFHKVLLFSLYDLLKSQNNYSKI